MSCRAARVVLEHGRDGVPSGDLGDLREGGAHILHLILLDDYGGDGVERLVAVYNRIGNLTRLVHPRRRRTADPRTRIPTMSPSWR